MSSGIRVVDEFFFNGVRYYTQEQLDAAVKAERERTFRVLGLHHKDRCCPICDTHVTPHRGCILR